MKHLFWLALVVGFEQTLQAQLFPAEREILNYRLASFAVPATKAGKIYKLEIALGDAGAETDFRGKMLLTATAKKPEFTTTLTEWGASYTWRISVQDNHGKWTTGDFHHFSTGKIPSLDEERARVTQNNGHYSKDYFFVDGSRLMYDMNGSPVWYLPKLQNIAEDSLKEIRDMKLTNRGTLTFLCGEQAREVDYKGRVLWKNPAPSDLNEDGSDHFHHEFTRLVNGHYMVMGKEIKYWKLDRSVDSAQASHVKTHWNNRKKCYDQQLEFTTLNEYDSTGKLCWIWKSSDYFKITGREGAIVQQADLQDAHGNSFDVDEKQGCIYVGFRNVSKILKVSYPGGKVLAAYKNTTANPGAGQPPFLFCNQHSCRKSADGMLYLFNNNLCMMGMPPTIMMLKEPAAGGNLLESVWQMPCELYGANAKGPLLFVAGGNVEELPGNNLFASLSGDGFSDAFIAGRDKKVVWNAFPERLNPVTHQWEALDFYRAHLEYRADALQKWVANVR